MDIGDLDPVLEKTKFIDDQSLGIPQDFEEDFDVIPANELRIKKLEYEMEDIQSKIERVGPTPSLL